MPKCKLFINFIGNYNDSRIISHQVVANVSVAGTSRSSTRKRKDVEKYSDKTMLIKKKTNQSEDNFTVAPTSDQCTKTTGMKKLRTASKKSSLSTTDSSLQNTTHDTLTMIRDILIDKEETEETEQTTKEAIGSNFLNPDTSTKGTTSHNTKTLQEKDDNNLHGIEEEKSMTTDSVSSDFLLQETFSTKKTQDNDSELTHQGTGSIVNGSIPNSSIPNGSILNGSIENENTTGLLEDDKLAGNQPLLFPSEKKNVSKKLPAPNGDNISDLESTSSDSDDSESDDEDVEDEDVKDDEYCYEESSDEEKKVVEVTDNENILKERDNYEIPIEHEGKIPNK